MSDKILNEDETVMLSEEGETLRQEEVTYDRLIIAFTAKAGGIAFAARTGGITFTVRD